MQTALMKKTLGVAAVVSASIFAQQSFAQSANCSYSISNEWNTGVTAAITITNTSTTAINGWTVGWQYTTNRLSGSWNANVSGNNPYSASNVSWNGTIQPGQSVQFGFQVDKRGGSAERPTVVGNICGGARSSAPSSVAASSSSTTAVSSSVRSSTASSVVSGQQCNWYGTIYPLCVSTQSGWGYENNRSCISRTTCASQPAPWGIVGGSSSQAISSSSRSSSSAILSSSSSSLVQSSSSVSSVTSSSSSSVVSSVVASSSLSSLAISSSSVGTSSSVNSSIANNIAVNGGVENGTSNWGTRGDATIVQSTADRYAGNASLFVSGRTAYWHGATLVSVL